MNCGEEESTGDAFSYRFIKSAGLVFAIYSCFQIAKRGFSYDELYSTLTSLSPTFHAMYDNWLSSDGFPFGYQTFLFLWLKLVPTSDFWVRLPHLLISTACLLYIAVAVRRRFGAFVAAFSIGLMLSCYNFLYYAYTVRVYSLIFFFSWIAILNVHKLSTNPELRNPPLSFVLTALILSYLHFFALFFVFFITSFLFLYRFTAKGKGFSEWGFYVKFAGLHTLFYAPCYRHLAYLIKLSYGKWQSTSDSDFTSSLVTNFAIPDFDKALFFYGSLLCLLGFAFLKGTRLQPGRIRLDSNGRYWLSFLCHNVLCTVVLSFAYKLNQDRYFIFFFPVLLLAYSNLLGIAISSLPQAANFRKFALILVSISSILTFYEFNLTKKQDWKRSTEYVISHRKEGNAVYVMGISQKKSSRDYLESANVDGYFYIRTLDFYRYYFNQLDKHPPPLNLYDAFSGAGVSQIVDHKRTFILAPHHLQLSEMELADLSKRFRVQEAGMFSTIVYILDPIDG